MEKYVLFPDVSASEDLHCHPVVRNVIAVFLCFFLHCLVNIISFMGQMGRIDICIFVDDSHASHPFHILRHHSRIRMSAGITAFAIGLIQKYS